MKFRLTDEIDWSFEFDVTDAADLVSGIRRGWDAHIAASTSVHPAVAHRARLAEIERWLSERETRVDATDEQRASWRANARHERWLADSRFGAGGTHPLSLHVLADATPQVWLVPVPHKTIAPRVNRTIDAGAAKRLLDGARLVVEHHARLMGMADSIGDQVGDALRAERFPRPKLVKPT